jgi:predicted AlkP superfamily pyrophosphatase or phosphodiesterase
MQKIAVINIVGLTQLLLERGMPLLKRWSENKNLVPMQPPLPAVTCSSQACMLTGSWPSEHGIVGNGWYFHDECEIKFWRQSNKLVQRTSIWEKAKSIDPLFRANNLFWWYNMYSSVDVSVTPRPMYTADGRKIPDCYTNPSHLRDDLQNKLGPFPLFKFWGPLATLESSAWIIAAAKIVETKYPAALNLVYVPHLDYCLQRLDHKDYQIDKELRELDKLCFDLIKFYEKREIKVVIVSEYGITPVKRSLAINQVLRSKGFIQVREELGYEQLDPGASKAFAVTDHQLAHIYVNDKKYLHAVYDLLNLQPEIAMVLDDAGKRKYHLNHARAGDFIAVSQPDAWFNYYFWRDANKAPDYARTVDIHRKPGYDPVELFFDPNKSFLKAQVMWKLMKKKMGFRQVLDVIPLQPELVQGSHGAPPQNLMEYPIIIAEGLFKRDVMPMVDVAQVILNNIFSDYKTKVTI